MGDARRPGWLAAVPMMIVAAAVVFRAAEGEPAFSEGREHARPSIETNPPSKEVSAARPAPGKAPLQLAFIALPPPPSAPSATRRTASAETDPSVMTRPAAPAVPPVSVPPVSVPTVSAPTVPLRDRGRDHGPTPPRSTVPETAGPAGSHRAGGAESRAGGPLLRLMEHGDGPDIRLAWPDSGLRRESLHRLLARCHGLELALLRADGSLLGVAADAGSRSGIAREPDGPLTRAETGRLAALQRLPGAGDARPVRLFDARFDRLLLGGLQRLVGRPLVEVGALRAGLGVRGGEVLVDDIVADGERLRGRLVIPTPAGCR